MLCDSSAIQSAVATIIDEMISGLDLDYDKTIDSGTRLIADLGFASVDFVHLIVQVESHFKRKMGFHDLIMPNGSYVDDLSVGQIVDFVRASLAGAINTSPAPAKLPDFQAPQTTASSPKLRPEDLTEFRALMPSLEKWGGQASVPTKPNPCMAFLLSSPRSGSTLLRVILAGNQRLFAPPELHLLYYGTMEQRRQALANEWNEHLLAGTVHAIMHLRSWSVEEATAFLRSCENREMPTHEFYGILQSLLGDRLMVDKTPTYAMNVETLRRAEEHFEAPLFVHLVRHPCAVIRSFEDCKLDQLTPFMRESRFTRRQLAELTWIITNENIVNFLDTVPRGRWLRIRYEDFLREPQVLLPRICDFLEVPFVSTMLDPYNDPDLRMTGGLRSVSEFSGDLKFHLHSRIDPEVANRWRKYDSESSLSEMSRSLASKFGY